MNTHGNQSIILHITDLHFKISRMHDQKIVIRAFLRDLRQQISEQGSPDLIVFSGDLVHNADDEKIYERLFDEFIEELLVVANCGYGRIVFCPGNHDLQRSKIQETNEQFQTISKRATDRNSLNGLYFNYSLNEITRIRMQQYFDFVEFFEPEGRKYTDELVQVFDIPEKNLSLVLVNTAWSGFGGIDKISDDRKLLFPEAALDRAFEHLAPDRFKICVQHHPLNWLAGFCESDAITKLSGNADMHLFGHVHDPRPMLMTDYNGSIFCNQSGALFSARDDRYMGYSLLKIEAQNRYTHAIWRTYYPKRETFDAATDVSDTAGNFFSSPDAKEYFTRQIGNGDLNRLKEWCCQENLNFQVEMFDQGLLDKPMSTVFVEPPLKRKLLKENSDKFDSGVFQEENVSLQDLLASGDSLVVFAQPEYGRTTLLKQICVRLASAAVENSNQTFIPVFLEFKSLSRGVGRTERAVRDALPDLPDGITISNLLEDGLMTLCVDDVDPYDRSRMTQLREFISKYKHNRFILSSRKNRESSFFHTDFGLPIHLQELVLEQLSRRNIRSLVKKWEDHSAEEEKVLERVISELRAINVPQTPINSSLLLDIISNDPTYSPINRPTLIERFIETLLQKRSLSEAQRRKFDFKNQTHFLGYLAEYMCKENLYSMTYDELHRFTADYLESIGLPFSAKDVLDNLINSRILGSRGVEDKLGFRFRAFLEFFTAQQISSNKDFREWVFAEERYLSFLNEIEYYAGLERSDSDLVELVSLRHLELANIVFGEKFLELLKSEDELLIPMTLEESISYAEDLAQRMNEAPLTESERDDLLEAEIPRDSEGRQEVYRPVPRHPSERFMLSLFMYSGLVKNSELIGNADKRRHLALVLKSWSFVFYGSFLHIPSLVKNRSMIVNGLRYIVSYPKEYTDNQVAQLIAVNMPKELGRLIFLFLGTEKLEVQLSEATLSEANEPRISKFFKDSLYMDLKLPNWWRVPQKFGAQMADSKYFQEAMLAKVSEVYRLGAYGETEAPPLQDAISEIYAKLYGGTGSSIQDLRNKKKANLRRDRILRVMREKKDERDG